MQSIAYFLRPSLPGNCSCLQTPHLQFLTQSCCSKFETTLIKTLWQWWSSYKSKEKIYIVFNEELGFSTSWPKSDYTAYNHTLTVVFDWLLIAVCFSGHSEEWRSLRTEQRKTRRKWKSRRCSWRRPSISLRRLTANMKRWGNHQFFMVFDIPHHKLVLYYRGFEYVVSVKPTLIKESRVT